MIQVKNLVKRYGDHTAVDDLTFSVEKGQIYGFLGPNGAGKSTTMNIMTGCLGATSGEVLIDGHSILREPEEAKRHIGYLPEQPPLYVEMTVREYLLFAAELRGISRAARAAAVDDAMEQTVLGDVQNRLIRNLSKGYRQRVGLAQAILGYPDVVILDEPTVGLDPKQIIEIRDLIRKLAQEHTVILSSHILSEVSAICDHIMIISHGKLVASGTPDELEALMHGAASLSLTIQGDEQSARRALSGVAGIESFEFSPGAQENELRLSVRSGERDVRAALFFAFAREQVAIVELTRSAVSLEQVFLELTEDPAGPDEQSEAPAEGAAQSEEETEDAAE